MKQTKLRRRRVFRYAVLYFTLLVVFVGMIVGPAVAGKNIPDSVENSLSGFGMKLFQPVDQDNDDTMGEDETGTGNPEYSGARKTSSAEDTAQATESVAERLRFLI